MLDGFLKVAAATPAIRVADCHHNAAQVAQMMQQAAEQGVSLCVFPEMVMTGYTCGDLFLQQMLLDSAEESLKKVLISTNHLDMVAVIGLPVRVRGKLYNCAAVCLHGDILGIVPKINLPNYSEFYEVRHFTSGENAKTETVKLCGNPVVFGKDVIFKCDTIANFTLGVEICEDLWVPTPPSCALCTAGATVIANPSASDEVIGKAQYRRNMLSAHAGRLACGYVYADAGQGESSQDLVYGGHNMIVENGAILAESKRFTTGLTITELDLGRLQHERQRMNTYPAGQSMTEIPFSLMVRPTTLTRTIASTPFVPSDKDDLQARCEEILTMQASGLATRLRHTNCKRVVIGLSGGLDSTLALIVCAHAFDMLQLPREGILAVTMPCFGTTNRTRSNAEKLAEAYGVELKTVDIQASVHQHFADIEHDATKLDVTYENAQARMRTYILMNLANRVGGLVVGTGDLSELALGWATYNGDHMSMYGVNCSIPKTLVRYLTAYEAARADSACREVLLDVLNTPVSPELLPPTDGEISQITEELVGPYELHDFFLYYMLRFGFAPRKIFRLATIAFADRYTPAFIQKWLVTFMRRFFSQQFKRSCLPDGPKVGTVTLSPRGDWRMPSDAVSQAWVLQAMDCR